jgi:phosphohistidine phosphatase
VPLPTRTLILVRHARAAAVAASDEERELTPEGVADAAEAGRWLKDQGYAVERALVSTARRTRQTWEALSEAGEFSAEAEFDGGLFAGGPDTVHDLVRHTSDDYSSLLVIGHNPTMAYLAQLLDDGEGGVDAVSAMSGGFPPCSVAVFDVPGSWDSLEVGNARLVAFHVGNAAA